LSFGTTQGAKECWMSSASAVTAAVVESVEYPNL
jgi:hypothetical protein